MAEEQLKDFERAVLDAISHDIHAHPEALQPVGAAIIERMRRLVAGVDVDLEQPLAPELDDAGMP
jgi:hypothetical protein